MNNNLVKKFFEFAIGNGLVIILGIISTAVVTRVMDPMANGRASLFITYTGLIVLLATMGIDQAFIRYYNDEDEENRGDLIKRAIKYPVIVSLVVYVGIIIFYKPLSNFIVKETSLFMMILFGLNILITVISNFALINIRMQQRAKTYSLVSATNKIVFLITLFVFSINVGKGYETIVFTTVSGNFAMLFFAIIAGRKEWFKKTDYSKLKVSNSDLRRYGMPFILSMGLTWIFQSADKISIDLLFGSNRNLAFYQNGLYDGAMRIVAILTTVQGVFTTFWIPVAYERYATRPDDTKFFSKISEIVSFFMLCIATGLMLFKDVVIMFLGGQYKDAMFVFPFLVMMPIMYTISETTFLGINFKKQTKKHIYIAGAAAIFNIIGNFILVPILGAKGAAISTGLAYVLFFIIRTYYGNKYYKIDINYKSLVPSVIVVYVLAILSSIYSFNSIILIASLLTFLFIFISYRKLILEFVNIVKLKVKK